MKIKNLSLQNIGCFYNYDWHSYLTDAEFSDKNIIYGDNGNGKSTLTKVFRHLNGDQDIPHKHRIDCDALDQRLAVNDSEDITGRVGRFSIFDKEFIKKNVSDIHDDIGDDIRRNNEKGRGEQYFRMGGFELLEKEYDQIVSDRDKAIQEKIKCTQDFEKIKGEIDSFDTLYGLYKNVYKGKELEKQLIEHQSQKNILINYCETLVIKYKINH